VLDEIRTFVVLAEAGSLHRAARRLYLTPSAVTRQIQRLEAALKTPLLDRSSKPAALTPTGRSVLEQGRELLRSYEELRALASPDAEPVGVFRLGLAHALARAHLVDTIQRFTRLFPGLRPQLAGDTTHDMLERLRSGDLEAALLLMPDGTPLPSNVAASVLATEAFTVVAPRSTAGTDDALDHPWVVNPRGCLIREALRRHVEKSGRSLHVVAEVNDLDLQLSLVAAGVGLAVVPARALPHHARRDALVPFTVDGFELRASVVFARATQLGRLTRAAAFLEDELRALYCDATFLVSDAYDDSAK
jgi:DNA-binding transcriptional LysR family regulator